MNMGTFRPSSFLDQWKMEGMGHETHGPRKFTLGYYSPVMVNKFNPKSTDPSAKRLTRPFHFPLWYVPCVSVNFHWIEKAINPFRAAFFLRGRNALLGNWRVNVFEYILSGKSTWRSTPSELWFFFREEGTLCLEIEERMYFNIYCPESQRGNQPLQSCVFFFFFFFFLGGGNTLLGNWRANVFEYILSGKSTWRSTASELRFFFFFLRGRNALLGDWRANVFEYILSGKSTWQSTPSEVRFFFFFWEEGTLCLKLEERMYLNIYSPESQRGDQSLQSCGFFENREHPSRKLKKIAYLSFSGEMKSECIRIYIVVIRRTDCLHVNLLRDLIFKVINLCFR